MSPKILPNLLVMPVQRPFNQDALWQGKIQLANYSNPKQNPPMILPKINNIVGGTLKDPSAPPIWEEVNQSYRTYSTSYWSRVKDAHNTYRLQFTYPKPPSSPSSFSPYQRKQDLTSQTQTQRQKPTPHASLEGRQASPLDQFS